VIALVVSASSLITAISEGFIMKNTTRSFWLFQLALLAVTLLGCASAADDPALPWEEGAASTSEALKGVAASSEEADLAADAADCDAADLASADSEEELASILQSTSVSRDNAELGLSTCRRVCNCCKGGNRFCCSHCRFCSGPIGPYGVSTSVLQP
jgi:hypothetical protein